MRVRPHDRPGRIVRGLLLAAAITACAAGPPDLRDHVSVLSSPELGGRLTGSEGERAAADYLSGELERLGAVPLPGRAFTIPFEFAAGTRDAGTTVSVAERAFHDEAHVRALSFSSNGGASAGAVFAGYGLVVPEPLGLAYDSYAGIDVRGKIAVVLRYFPEDLPDEPRAILSRYSGLRYKAMLARERGAVGLLVVTGPRSPNAGKTIPMTFDAASAGSGIPAASVSSEVAEALFAGTGTTLAQVQAALDQGSPHTGATALAVQVALDARVERERRQGHNVVGLLPGVGEPPARPWVVVGAHYDHLGTGRHGGSLAREGEEGEIHVGADDNASGVAAVLRIGELLAGTGNRRSLVLAFFSGEEIGLLGSSAFLDESLVDPRAIAAYLNFDMVGRARGDRLAIHGVGTSGVWRPLVEQANATTGFELSLVDDPFLPTDSASFDHADVPTLNFFTGAHADYHRPTDVESRLNYRGLERVARLGASIAGGLAHAAAPPDFVRLVRTADPGVGRDALRAFTGTIPDYTTEAQGLALAGVVAGGPAAEAGLRGGDVIVRLGGHRIANIYDYTYALEVVRIGQPVKVVYLRNGERLEAEMTPRERH